MRWHWAASPSSRPSASRCAPRSTSPKSTPRKPPACGRVASPEAFRAAGLDYNPALTDVQITLQRRADGRYFLRLTSDRAVNDPFVDLILEATWASGRIVRDYTMLFDPPPAPAGAAPVAPRRAAARAAAPRRRAPPAPRTGARRRGRAAAHRAAPRRTSARSRAAAAGAAPAAARRRPRQRRSRSPCSPGDTAGRIAAANKPANVSLDQMLVAMLRANPDAFVGGNVNRIKAGAVLDIPTRRQAGAIAAGEARRIVVAQSRDFNEFRRRLAETRPRPRGRRRPAGQRPAAGQVEDSNAAAAAPDKLTLSKGALHGQAAEEQIARRAQAQGRSARAWPSCPRTSAT